jgi:hypothetical protein
MSDDLPPAPAAGSEPPPPRTDGVLVGMLAAVILVVAGASWLFDRRLRGIEERLKAPPATAEAPPAAAAPAPADGDSPRPPTLKSLAADLQQLNDDTYQYYVDTSADLHEIKRWVKQVRNLVRAIGPSAGRPGVVGAWGLPELGRTPSAEVLARIKSEAEAFGVKVEDGRVEVPGFLNLAPNRAMPIEYFVTRWPVASHETLVHVHGSAKISELTEERMLGLPTAVYKGLVAAGFTQGEGSRFEVPTEGEKPVWVPPTGDKVYVGVRYRLNDTTHVARATDWIVDPSKRAVLPEDSFRFTGSRRGEDPETGDEMLSAEQSGLLVSVYIAPAAIVEIAVPSNVNDDYQYNYARIPRPEGEGPLLLDLILSKTPIAVEGDGARPIEPVVVEPPPGVDPGTKPEGPPPARDPFAPGMEDR